ncbi:MAG: glycosyltransferase involved in cell wall biosynthesis [Hyphomicrobiaceae bacterium]|jgi:glycosyltransferase involved in cell wall biosynthesis
MSTGHANDTTRDPPQLVSIVVPVFNEQDCVGEMSSRVRAALEACHLDYELIYVDDGSSDDTLACIRAIADDDPRVRYVSFSRNFGHQMALFAGVEHACGDVVVSLDGDLQHPPELIPELIERWREGYDVVYTVRTGNEGHALKEAFSGAFYWLMRSLTGVDVATGGADFRLLDRKVAEVLRNCEERFIFVRGLVPWLGFRRIGVEYRADERFAGQTKYLPARMFRFALDGIFSFSILPLRFIAALGAATVGLGLIYGFYSVVVRLILKDAVSGWTSLIVIILVFSGTQLLSLGILSEYVGRIYEEVKHRPRYIVDHTNVELQGNSKRDKKGSRR